MNEDRPPTYPDYATPLDDGPAAERIEIRRNDDGTIDEVLFFVGIRCVFHLEQNSKHSWYFGLYPNNDLDQLEQFSISSKRRVRIANHKDQP